MNDGTYAFIMLELNIDNAVRNLADQALWFDGEYIETNTLSEASKELYHSVLLMNVNPNRGKAYDQFVYDMKVAMSKAPFYSREYEGVIVRRNRTYYNFNKKVCFLTISHKIFLLSPLTSPQYTHTHTHTHAHIPTLRTRTYDTHLIVQTPRGVLPIFV